MPGLTKVCLWLSFLCLAVVTSATARAQSIYLCLGSNSTNLTPADYQNCATEDAAEIKSFSFGVTSPATASGTPGVAAVVSSLSLDKLVDATSKQLLRSLFLRSGTPLGPTLAIGMIATPSVTGGPGSLNNITILLHYPVVTSVSQGGGGGSNYLSESVTLIFKQITVIDNTVSPPKSTTWTAP